MIEHGFPSFPSGTWECRLDRVAVSYFSIHFFIIVIIISTDRSAVNIAFPSGTWGREI
jgi:hypothetical protein